MTSTDEKPTDEQRLARAYRDRLAEDVNRMIAAGTVDRETLGVALVALGIELQTVAGCSDTELAATLRGLADLHAERAVVSGHG